VRKASPLRFWLPALGMTALLFAALAQVSNFRFENSDDALIVKAFMGYEGGLPAIFSLYVHTALAWLLHGLALLVPRMPWFSLFQGMLLLASCTVIAKSMLQLAQGRYSNLLGVLMGGLYLVLFAAFAACRINYTTTAALAGAAAVAQCLTAPLQGGCKRRVARAYRLSALLLAIAFCLRMQGALPAAAFLALTLLWQYAAGLRVGVGTAVDAEGSRTASHDAHANATNRHTHVNSITGEPPANAAHRDSPAAAADGCDITQPTSAAEDACTPEVIARERRSNRRMGAQAADWQCDAVSADPRIAEGTVMPPRYALKALLWTALLLAALFGVRQGELAIRGLQADVAWHSARTALMDYTAFESDPSPALAVASGLSPSLTALVQRWYFMDSAITEDALQTMAQAYVSPAPLQAVARRFASLFTDNPRYVWAVTALVLMLLLCLLRGWKAPPYLRLAATLALVGAGAMLVLLAWQGRVLPRAADAVLFPAAALLFGLTLRAGGVVTLAGSPAEPASKDTALSSLTQQAISEPVKNGAVGYCAVPRARGAIVRRMVLFLLVTALLFVGGKHAALTLHAITRKPDAVSQQRQAELDRFALAHPAMLILRSPSLLRDTRLMPDTGAGIPSNTAVWGDWTCRTPGWYRQLAIFGLDGHALTAAVWLEQPLLLAASSPEDAQPLLAYLQDTLSLPVYAVLAGEEGTLQFYRFAV